MAKSPEDLLIEAAISGDASELSSLLSTGADPSSFDASGRTPLMHAAERNHSDAVRLLLDAGAPWNALSPSGLSAGDLAMANSHQVSLDLLLDAAIRSELILGTIARRNDEQTLDKTYLDSRVEFGEDRLMDEESKAVMMAWEGPLMEAHARAVCGNGGKVLNVGFGMGLVDEAIQRYGEVTEHTIVEAHPDVYARMMRLGWGEKKNTRVVFGKWQDVLPQLASYDGIFFDTYGEYYEDLREFHQHLPKLLKPGGIYSYFNGLCGGNAFFHVVYCQLVSLELGNIGYSTQFIPLPVKDCLAEDVWEGVKHKYWQLDTYYLPVCQASSDADD
ncbi:arginine N-methyltransferase 2 [Iris pallida]|uniref:Protein arginine N-methyltransferase 2 n=1 Tax=Iris pallida TaxID=29817 RepID=A0AAX6HSS5_IRIPA|nr:arginine N-methyltransferase 2 [Iris pallida]